uniref:Uncharacterized protein n=1 Tax=Branchiostoma floridae TaxID=7739 RepID=C3ZZC3_BRAFL|eukprot:XP_002586096.1 hypothetical protein BRAFLDRAFT_108217 [Branchiostoma floridae]
MSGGGSTETDVQIVAQRLAEIGDTFEQEFFAKKIELPRRPRRRLAVELSGPDGEASRRRPWPDAVLLAWHVGVLIFLMHRDPLSRKVTPRAGREMGKGSVNAGGPPSVFYGGGYMYIVLAGLTGDQTLL